LGYVLTHRGHDDAPVLHRADCPHLSVSAPKISALDTGIYNERGAETIERIVSMFAGHDLNHFQQIESILAAKKK
jgi:hypothetical protein